MSEGREFKRFIVCILLGFLSDTLLTKRLALDLHNAGYIKNSWNIMFVGFIISFIIVYVLSFVLFKAGGDTNNKGKN